MNQRQQTGKLGEQLAQRHLKGEGYKILQANYRASGGEIDLIAEKDGEVIFVEVKTRRGLAHGTPEESITPRKQQHIIAAAQEYLQATGNEERNWRIDVVAIELDRSDKVLRLEIIENAVGL